MLTDCVTFRLRASDAHSQTGGKMPPVLPPIFYALAFYALYGMPAGTSDKKYVRPSLSVRPSVKRVHCDKTEEIFVQIFIPYERSFSVAF